MVNLSDINQDGAVWLRASGIASAVGSAIRPVNFSL